MVKTVSREEKEAAIAGGPAGLANETGDEQVEDILVLEELAALYVSRGGDDPRAMKIFEAAKAAGRIGENGEWIDQE